MLVSQLSALGLFSLAWIVVAKVDVSKYTNVIHRDVAIIGGGASGAHAAVRLREDFKKSVVVVERQGILGGHVDTYVDKENGRVHDYGVQVYFAFGDALDFFARFNLTYNPRPAASAVTTRYVDFSTGTELLNITALDAQRATSAIRKFHDLMVEKGYDKMTEPGYWHLPPGKDIPEDLLLPIGELVKKYDIEPMLPRVYASTGGGVGSRGDFEKVMTLTFMKSFPIGWAKAMLGEIPMVQLRSGNQELFDRVASLLGNDVVYNAEVVDSERGEDGVKLVVKDRQGERLVIAKKLLLAVQPARENLKPLDLNDYERELFSKPKYGRSHTGIARHSKLKRGTSFRNTPTSARDDPSRVFLSPPFVLSLSSYGNNSGLFSLGASGSDYNGFDVAAAQKMAQQALEKMADSGIVPDLEGEQLQFVAWSDHDVGGFGVSAEDMRKGWMADLYGLQGKRSTWFTGGGVAPDFSTILWKFNDDLLPRMLKEM